MVFTSSVALVPHRCLLTHTHTQSETHTHTAAHAGKLGEFRFYPPRCTFNGVDMVLWPLWPLTHTPRKLHCLPFFELGEWALGGGGRFFITFILCFLWFCASAFVFRLFNFPFAPPTKEPSFLSWFSCTPQYERNREWYRERSRRGGCWSERDVRAASICVRRAWVVLWLKLFGFHCSSVVAKGRRREFNISNGFMQLRVAHLHLHFIYSAVIESSSKRAFEVDVDVSKAGTYRFECSLLNSIMIS